jgi:competence protein ComGC
LCTTLPARWNYPGRDGVLYEIDKAAMARSIPALIEKGYLRKEKDAVDKRANKYTSPSTNE